jgi:alginate O-acetyltransferase complex protein AlgI
MTFVPIYILILGFTIIVDFFSGIYIEKSEGKRRRLFLILSLMANVGVLAVFKYYNFINENLSFLLQSFGFSNPVPYLSILLPIGLSFHTFQAMSYTIEIYRGNQKAERHFGIYSLYVMFYPQLVAGPIERPQNLLHQFREEHQFDYRRVTDGLKLMAWGLFKKVVIADRLSMIVDNVYDSPYDHHGLSLIIATIFFSFQIYCDFSGYADIAIGAARVMGFDLMTNFNRPYHATSIADFWRRWHISLSTWLSDYIFKPLQTNLRYYKLAGNILAILVTFLLSGLWHGANWNYVIWGALHGTYLVFSLITKDARRKVSEFFYLEKFPMLKKGIQVFSTFSLVTFAWIFFRAKSLAVGLYVVKSSIMGLPQDVHNLTHNLPLNLNFGVMGVDLFVAIFSIIGMETMHIIQNKYCISSWLHSKPAYFRWGIYYTVILTIVFFGISQNKQFIYFQF